MSALEATPLAPAPETPTSHRGPHRRPPVRRRRAGGPPQAPSGAPRVPGDRIVLLAWGALMMNVLAFSADLLLLPIPKPAAQALTQGSLVVALLAALWANRRLELRMHWFIGLLAILAVAALMNAPHNEFPMGSTFRAVRFTVFVVVLWLLTPWWHRRDMVLLRVHRVVLGVVLANVVLGALASPGLAFSFEGRLSGILWPIPPTQVGHYAAIMFGTTAVLWLTRVLNTPWAWTLLAISGGMLLATHTRTALAATLFGLGVAVLSLYLGHRRVRHATAITVAGAAVLLPLLAGQILGWLSRGQSAQEATELTGRTKVWDQVVATPRPLMQDLVGSGLTNRSFNGLPIDSNWFAAYWDQGWLGVVVCAAFLLGLFGYAWTRARGPHRAAALFIVCYCALASVTETGLSDASPYLLDLAVAAALLTAAGPRPRPFTGQAA